MGNKLPTKREVQYWMVFAGACTQARRWLARQVSVRQALLRISPRNAYWLVCQYPTAENMAAVDAIHAAGRAVCATLGGSGAFPITNSWIAARVDRAQKATMKKVAVQLVYEARTAVAVAHLGTLEARVGEARTDTPPVPRRPVPMRQVRQHAVRHAPRVRDAVRGFHREVHQSAFKVNVPNRRSERP